MIDLFIDTSSSDVSIALLLDGKIISSKVGSFVNQHSIYTTSFLEDVLNEAGLKPGDVDRIMVVNGPGSFTGIRIGVTIAKVYAYLLKKDVICISSLKMRAISIEHDYCMSLIDARNGNYYMGLYDKNNSDVYDECFVNKDRVLELINKYSPVIVSDSEFLIDDILVKKVCLDVVKIVSYYKDSEPVNCHLVAPNYLKLPQALENLK